MSGPSTASTLAGLPAGLLVAYLGLVLPVSGWRRYRTLREQSPADPDLRIRAYRRSISRQWLLTGLALVLLVLAGAPLSDVGLDPRLDHWADLAPGLVVLAAGAVVLALLLRSWPAGRQRILRPVAALLPVTGRERQLFAVVAITAGVTEEVLFRGFLLAYLTDVFPHLALPVALVAAAVLFGLAHSYQGVLGVLLTGLAGYWLGGLYVLTGSLLLPIVVHALVDLRLLLVLPRRPAGRPRPVPYPDAGPARNAAGGGRPRSGRRS